VRPAPLPGPMFADGSGGKVENRLFATIFDDRQGPHGLYGLFITVDRPPYNAVSGGKLMRLRSYTPIVTVPTAPVSLDRVVVALIWALAVIGALIEIPLGIIWAGGGIGDFKRPEPFLPGLLPIGGLATCILGIALITSLMWGLGLPLSNQRDPIRSKATAARLALIAMCLIATGAIIDLARGEGNLFITLTLAIMNGPSLIAAFLLFPPRSMTSRGGRQR
jgi:hypothetical protein